MADLYYEDVVVGEERESALHTVTLADIKAFAEITLDDHPLHWDEEFCKSTVFGRPICPSHLFHLSQKPWNFASPPDTLSGMR